MLLGGGIGLGAMGDVWHGVQCVEFFFLKNIAQLN